MEKQQERRNLVTCSTAVELATRTIIKVMGNDCAKTQHGQKLTRQVIADNVSVKLAGHINDATRG